MRYLSDDGVKFDTEQECREYEDNIRRIKESFVLYDDKLNVIEVNETNRYEYIHILANPEEVESFIYQQTGWSGNIIDVGIYKLSGEGEWQNIDTLIKEYTDNLEYLKLVKHTIDELI